MTRIADSMRESCGLHRYIETESATPEGVGRRWRQVFNCVCRDFGFTRKQRKYLWENLVLGNWGHLHQTEEESEKPTSRWLEELSWDVFYCSDRWSMDRLTRCHWTYRQYREAVEHEQG